jgi:hypothetical protein
MVILHAERKTLAQPAGAGKVTPAHRILVADFSMQKIADKDGRVRDL